MVDEVVEHLLQHELHRAETVSIHLPMIHASCPLTWNRRCKCFLMVVSELVVSDAVRRFWCRHTESIFPKGWEKRISIETSLKINDSFSDGLHSCNCRVSEGTHTELDLVATGCMGPWMHCCTPMRVMSGLNNRHCVRVSSDRNSLLVELVTCRWRGAGAKVARLTVLHEVLHVNTSTRSAHKKCPFITTNIKMAT